MRVTAGGMGALYKRCTTAARGYSMRAHHAYAYAVPLPMIFSKGWEEGGGVWGGVLRGPSPPRKRGPLACTVTLLSHIAGPKNLVSRDGAKVFDETGLE